MALRPKQKRFIAAYIENGGNATQAALMAYPGASYASARVIGCHNLTKLNVRTEIEGILNPEGHLDRAIQVLDDALDAKKRSGEPDHGKRLRAAIFIIKTAMACE